MAPQRRTRASAAAALAAEPQQLSSPPVAPAPATKGRSRGKVQPSPAAIKQEVPETPAIAKRTPKSTTRKRARETDAADDDNEEKILDELPHGLGAIATPDDTSDSAATKVKAEDAKPARKRAKRSTPAKVKTDPEDVKDVEIKAEDESKSAAATPSRAKAKKPIKYGFMPGQSPYPDWPHPTAEECYEVDRILSKVHGKVKPPAVIPVPSVTVAGCGEVPSVLDALIRTRLSAATTNTNSSRAFQGLMKTFGIIKEGVGQGSVDWNKVRLASQPEVFDAIKVGGLAQVKSKDIKLILDVTYDENQARRAALTSSSKADPAGAENEDASEKQSEVARAESSVLSLDHFHAMETQDAIDKMCEFPGIGMKTAACVALFCLRRSCFAVDTHVFRLCQYLNWVPPKDSVQPGEPKVGRNTTYTHCEARVPDELKYSLHQLLIKHGKTCPRCRAATTVNSAEWSKGCPIEHLVTRFEAKKNGAGEGASAVKSAKGTAGTKKKGKAAVVSEESEEEEEAAESEGSAEESEVEDVPTPKRTFRKRAAKAKAAPKIKKSDVVSGESEEDESSALSDMSSEFEDEDE